MNRVKFGYRLLTHVALSRALSPKTDDDDIIVFEIILYHICMQHEVII